MADQVRTRRWLLAGTTALAPLLFLGSLPFEVSTADVDEGLASLAVIAADRDQFWAANLAVAVGLVMLGLSGLAVMALVRARGGALATVGGCLMVVGGTAAAGALGMYGAVMHAATDPSLDREVMAAFDDIAGDSLQAGLPFVVGFVGVALGLLLCGLALWRSGAVPLFVSIPLVLAGPVMFFSTGDGWQFALSLTPQLALIGVAAELVRRPRTVVLPDVPAQGAPAEGVSRATAPA